MAEEKSSDRAASENFVYTRIESEMTGKPTPWHYTVSMPQPETHLFQIELAIANWLEPTLNLHMPVWSPGSYLIREYARLVQDVRAVDHRGRELPCCKTTKNCWQVILEEATSVRVGYKVFANELSVRTNHLDGTHGYFNGGATFLFAPGWERHPLTIEIVLPRAEWRVATALPAVPDRPNTYHAVDFDTLVDSPFEIGIHSSHEFTVLGIPHRYVIWGQGNVDPERLMRDTSAIVEQEAAVFGGLPYDSYLFLLHLSSYGNGGLEHKNCCSLNYKRLGFRKDSYLRFMSLVAHEFFHTWNVKRIRPKALETFNYQQESYTSALWFSEGTTSYYDQIFPLRARLYDTKFFLKQLGESITRLQNTPGRLVQSLAESSLDTWIKLYRPDANSQNVQISYYLKGELVSLLLDLLIRHETNHRRSLDDVMRAMWQYFGKAAVGFTDAELLATIEAIAGRDLQDFWQAYLYGTDELDYNFYFEPFGLEVQPSSTLESPPRLGIAVQAFGGTQSVKFVEANSPAQLAGINAGDELLAIDGIKVTGESLNDRLQEFQPGDAIEITIFRHDLLATVHAVLAPPTSDRHTVVSRPDPSSAQRENLSRWLT